MKNLVRNFLDRGGHCIDGIDGANDRGPAFIAAIVLDADRLDIGNYYKILPNLFGKTADIEFLAENSICLAERVQSVTGDSAETANTETGTGEGLTVNHCVRKTECFADYADLVLIKKLDRLDELELKVLGKTADVVVGLNSLFALCLLNAFKNIGINGALCEKRDALEFACFVGENVYKFRADDLSLAFGVGNACEKIEEAIGRIDVDEVCIELILEDLYYVFGFILTHKTVVYVNTDELLADSLYQKCGYDRGIHTAGECEKNLLFAYLCANFLYLLLDKRVCELEVIDTSHRIGTKVVLHIYIPPKLCIAKI